MLVSIGGRGLGVWICPDQLRVSAEVNVAGLILRREVWAHLSCLSREGAAEKVGAAVLNATREAVTSDGR